MAYKCILTIGYNIFVKELYKQFERWQKTCHFLHSSLVLLALDRLYKPLEKLCCIFWLKKHREANITNCFVIDFYTYPGPASSVPSIRLPE
jgi:hypothetical protein